MQIALGAAAGAGGRVAPFAAAQDGESPSRAAVRGAGPRPIPIPARSGRRPTTTSTPRSEEIVRRMGKLVAASSAMHQVFDLIQRFAPTGITMTLTGETGSGKDVIAHAIHDASPNADGPFIVFDCGAVPPNLVESELF